MSDPIKRSFIFTSDGTTHDATVGETSESLSSCFNYRWSVTPITSGLVGGPPTYTIEVSNDDVTWFEYNNESTDVSVIDAVEDDHLAFIFMRIVHTVNGTTNGTVEYLFTQKNG